VRIVPVVDVRGGIAVHARGGDRANYRPLRSPLSVSTEPASVASALAAAVGATDVYLAELDAIESGRCKFDYRTLANSPFTTWIDTGVRSVADLERFPQQSHLRPILGSETLPSLAVLKEATLRFPVGELLVSLDFRAGQALGSVPHLFENACELGVRRFLILDIAAVGRGTGVWAAPLLDRLRKACPDAILWAGGGVASMADVTAWHAAGADAVLVATALHAGAVPGPGPG
jgi:phosphoribosylformimino-5-aminoimidazole carboxamide ribotide isomerase